MMPKKFGVFAFSIVIHLTALASTNSDLYNKKLLELMQAYHVPTVGYAIIKNNKIIAIETLTIDPNIHVNGKSLFQAASISKSVTAVGILKLASNGKINLDANINQYLRSWKIPSNEFTRRQIVTARNILAMTSGLSVSGFPGYEQGVAFPTLIETLNGIAPANTAPILVNYLPGSKYEYSGGGFEVLEQVVIDLTKEPFAHWMQKNILKPFRMNESTFQSDLSDAEKRRIVHGYLLNGKEVKQGWLIYPAATGGLWTTPSDLARFAIAVTKAYHQQNCFLSRQITNKIFKRQKNSDYGLGFVVSGQDKSLNIRKAGHNLGYHSQLLMFPNSGDGIVIMTNSENGEYVINYFIAYIAQQMHWPKYFPFFDELVRLP